MSASYDSVRGPIAVRWKRTADRAGARRDRAAERHADGFTFPRVERDRPSRPDPAASVRLVGVEGGRVVYEVGSGRYQFRTR